MSGDIVKSFKVASTLAANRIVTILTGTANSVEYPAASTGNPCIGVTLSDVKDTTGSVPVKVAGIAEVYFHDTCAAGLVGADSSGRGVPFSAVTGTASYVGILVGPAVAATGTIAQVLIQPGVAKTV